MGLGGNLGQQAAPYGVAQPYPQLPESGYNPSGTTAYDPAPAPQQHWYNSPPVPQAPPQTPPQQPENPPWQAPWYGQTMFPQQPPPPPARPTPQLPLYNDPNWRPPQFQGILPGERDFRGNMPSAPAPREIGGGYVMQDSDSRNSFVDPTRNGMGAPPGFYPPTNRQLSPAEQQAYHQMVNWGIDPRILYQAPTSIRNLGGNTGGIFDTGTGQVTYDKNVANTNYGATPIHEQMHAMQFNMTPEEQSQLGELMKANPPPQGPPTEHHSEGYLRLPTYFDYLPFSQTLGRSRLQEG
jgi:hypothetical protein